MKIVLTPSDLHSDDFAIERSGSDGGLIVRVKPKDIVTYDAVRPAETVARFANNDGARHRLALNGKFGYLHLDFIAKKTTCGFSDRFSLPNDAPTPISLIEAMTADGGAIFVGANTRSIRWNNLTVDKRYVVDLIGFWNV